MALLFYSEFDRSDLWARCLHEHLPDLDFRTSEAAGDPSEIHYVLVWRPPAGWLSRFPRLRCILSLGAGVDHLVGRPDLPPGVPIVRVVDEHLTQRMVEYVVLHVLRHHRRMPTLLASQRRARWRPLLSPVAQHQRVGILGLGVLGSAAATALAGLGFRVSGWARGPHELDGVRCLHGADGLNELLAETRLLVCLLPLTDETRGLIDGRLLRRLPRGACLINAGRGEHVVESDLRAALDDGWIAEATLDVFDGEPLGPEHWAWSHPSVTVTAHTASITDPHSASRGVAEAISAVEAGQPPRHTVVLKRGY